MILINFNKKKFNLIILITNKKIANKKILKKTNKRKNYFLKQTITSKKKQFMTIFNYICL